MGSNSTVRTASSCGSTGTKHGGAAAEVVREAGVYSVSAPPTKRHAQPVASRDPSPSTADASSAGVEKLTAEKSNVERNCGGTYSVRCRESA